VCERLQLDASPRIPRVLVVVDRSGSMGGERWDQVIASVDRLVDKFSDFEFGLALYPAVGEELTCGPGDVVVAPANGTADAMHEVLFAEASRAITDDGYTPTAETLRVAQEALAFQLDDFRSSYVLLVTDGQPNCNLDGPEKYTADVEQTLVALDDLRELDIPTFVIGYRTQDVASIMDDMAEHGGTTQHYAVEDEKGFAEAFGQIGQSLMPCSFELEQTPPGIEYVRVVLDGESLPALGTDGFSVSGERTVELGSARCSAVRDGAAHSIEVFVECDKIHLL
jgi:uncharacterized protein YegL